MEAEKISVPKVIVTTAKSAEPATPPALEKDLLLSKSKCIFCKEMKTDAVEIKSTVSSHFITSS